MPCHFQLIENTLTRTVLRDIGAPWTHFSTITNDAERVTKELFEKGIITNDKQLLYFDSDNSLTEIKHQDGHFLFLVTTPTTKKDEDENSTNISQLLRQPK